MGLLPHGPFSSSQMEPPYYPSQSHEAARKAALMCLGDGEKGFYLAGPPGAGKTTVLRQVLKHQAVPDEILFVHSGMALTRRELIQSLLFDCQLPVDGSEIELHLRLTDYLAAHLGCGRTVWIVVDDSGALDTAAFKELIGLTRLPGQSGARLQVLLSGNDPSGEFSCLSTGFQTIELAPWAANELADWIRQRIGAITGKLKPGPGRELMDLLVPGGTGLPGQVLDSLRSAWRLLGDPERIYPDAFTLAQVIPKFSSEIGQKSQRNQSRRPFDEVEDISAKVIIPNQAEMDLEGLEEWMASSSTPAFSWEQGG